MGLERSVEGKAAKVGKAGSVGRLLAGGKARIEWDGEVPHFGIRILPNGERRWVVVKRPAGSTRVATVTLGDVGGIPRRKAVSLAYEAIARLAAGENPNATKKAARAAEKAARAEAGNTFLQVGRSYIKRCAEKGRRATTLAEYQRVIHGADLEGWHARPVAGITAREIEAVVDRIRQRAPVMANRVLEVVAAVFRHAARKGLIAANPMDRIDRDEVRTREVARRRTLVHPYTGDLSELRAVWKAAESIEPENHPLRALVKLLILTGLRVGVCARSHPGQSVALTWAHVKDLDRPEHARLEIPAALRKTGNGSGEVQVVPLVPAAVAALSVLAKVGENAPVFTVTGERALKVDDGVRDDLRARADTAAGGKLEHWTLHDLRRSVATGLGHLGCPAAVLDEILDHAGEAKRGIRAVYDRSQRVAMCGIGCSVGALP